MQREILPVATGGLVISTCAAPMTWSTKCAAVRAMCRAPHDGQKPRRLQLKANSLS